MIQIKPDTTNEIGPSRYVHGPLKPDITEANGPSRYIVVATTIYPLVVSLSNHEPCSRPSTSSGRTESVTRRAPSRLHLHSDNRRHDRRDLRCRRCADDDDDVAFF